VRLHYTAGVVAFRLYRSNRAEKLANALTEVVRGPQHDPFARECIVVQGPGMERWLSGVLATRLGIWANPWFPFPRAAVELILDAGLGADAESEAFSPDALAFRCAALLPELLEDRSFAEAAHYLRGDRAGERLIALARKLGAGFDQYLVYRPELVLSWERGQDEHFQAKLWRALIARGPGGHLARRMQALAERGPAALEGARAALPARICLFGLSTLAPAFLRLLRGAARHVDVHMFVLCPARDYWGDLDRSQRHLGDAQGLLANLGKTSRELLDLLLEDGPPGEQLESEDLFETPPQSTLLGALQADLLELAVRAPGLGGAAAPRALPPDDDSLRVHVCHSLTRELEVLRDELRDRFERDPSLAPGDVVVLAPDIERYAPAIEAVFSQLAPEEPGHLPHRVADRKAQRASEVASAFLALLDLLGSRVPLSELLDLLHRPALRARFEIEEADLDRAQRWLIEAGARWAVDAEHRARFGQPAFAESSLRFALDRLLLGLACAAGEKDAPFGVLPCDQVEGQQALLLGRVARFVDTIAGLSGACAASRSVPDWARALSAALGAMISDAGELSLEHHQLRTLLFELADHAERAAFERPVSLQVMRGLLEEKLDRGRLSGGFLSRGITFCEHLPMRAIPFRLVCLLGMDDESFPRSAARPSFDLMAAAPRRGDRNLRDDDRQLFLDALVSARDALIITYVGRSAQDDGERPICALVEHLLRVIDRHFVPTAADHTLRLGFEGSASALVTRVHALHRFDRRYFRAHGRGALFSYDQGALAAARAQLGQRSAPPPFVARPLRWSPDSPELTLEGLERFFRHPQKRFLKQRLSVLLPRDVDPIRDREPTRLDPLERYQIGDQLLSELAGLSPELRARVLLQSGRLPPGSPGRVQLAEIEALVSAVLGARDPGPRLPDRELKLELGRFRLIGRLDRIFEAARVEWLVSTLSTKHKLSAWIRHLVLCASGERPNRSLLIGRNKDLAQVVEFGPVADASALLSDLLALYELGMRMPLPYLHRPAEALLERLAKGNEQAAWDAAISKALPAARGQLPHDADDAHVRQVFSLKQLEELQALFASDGIEQLSFRAVAERILLPMERHTLPETRR
jgi:exodeoxyribonuclease V gamma subunit